MVALGVFSLCATLLYESLHFSGRLWIGARRRVEAQESVETAQLFLRARLESIEPYRAAQSGDAPPAVSGTVEGIEFTAPPPKSMGLGSLRYQIRLRASRDDRQLIVRWRRSWDGRFDPVAGPDWHEDVLIANIVTAEFAYLDVDRGDAPAWQPGWSGPRPPKAIRLAIRFPAADDRHWRRFVVRPWLDDDPICEFDVVSRRCRE